MQKSTQDLDGSGVGENIQLLKLFSLPAKWQLTVK